MRALPRAAPDLTGTVLEGAYRLVRVIGQGGMGAVYEAIQLRLNKRVAVKLMARELASSQTALARFHREAEITSQLGHPHLVNVVDFGTAETGEPYLVMEYLEGEDLEHRMVRQGRLPVESAVHIIRQVASALSAAHAKDIVHRDLKPANVFLLAAAGEPDFVKVLDFGISKVKAASARLTRAQAVVGTPNYMSPEQATGKVDETDHRADQWALACITWEMLTGRTPFIADDVSALLYQIVNVNPPPLGPLAANLHPEVEGVLRQALSKRFNDRFPSIRDFARAFEAAAFNRPPEITLVPLTPPVVTPVAGVPFQYESAPASQEPTELASEAPAGLLENVQVDAKRLTTFSQTTGEVTSIMPARWLNRRRKITIAAGLAVVVMGAFIFFKSDQSGPPAMLAPPPPVAIPTVVTPLPSPEAAPAPVPEPSLPVQPSTAKPATKTQVHRAAFPVGKRKTDKERPKHRIFQEL
jgi:serine/threonine-protein kinase